MWRVVLEKRVHTAFRYTFVTSRKKWLRQTIIVTCPSNSWALYNGI